MTRPVSDRPRSWSWSWSYTFGLASNTVCADKTLCDMIMLKCIISTCVVSRDKYRNSAKCYWPSLFWRFCTKFFLITDTRVATEEFFFCYVFICCLTGLGLGLNILVMILSLNKVVHEKTVSGWSFGGAYVAYDHESAGVGGSMTFPYRLKATSARRQYSSITAPSALKWTNSVNIFGKSAPMVVTS